MATRTVKQHLNPGQQLIYCMELDNFPWLMLPDYALCKGREEGEVVAVSAPWSVMEQHLSPPSGVPAADIPLFTDPEKTKRWIWVLLFGTFLL